MNFSFGAALAPLGGLRGCRMRPAIHVRLAQSFGLIAVLNLADGCASFTVNSATPRLASSGAASAKALVFDDMYVANYGRGTVFRFRNDGFTPDGSIKSGVSGPWGVTLDGNGNLYVANAAGGNITEYAPGITAPIFTYSSGMVSPRLVSVDRNGNVFESDFTDDYSQLGRVSEFPQGTNEPLHSCSILAPWGIATDSSGDVFVAHNLANGGGGRVAEFKGGLVDCAPTDVGAHVGRAFGLAIDRRGNILLADYNAARIDVIPPPYTAISRRLKTGGSGPLFIAIDSSNKRVFASVPGFYRNKVLVIDYASGQVERKLGGGRRLDSAYGVADGLR